MSSNSIINVKTIFNKFTEAINAIDTGGVNTEEDFAKYSLFFKSINHTLTPFPYISAYKSNNLGRFLP